LVTVSHKSVDLPSDLKTYGCIFDIFELIFVYITTIIENSPIYIHNIIKECEIGDVQLRKENAYTRELFRNTIPELIRRKNI